MIQKLTKVGESNALIIDKRVMELLGLGEDAEVQLTVSEGSLIVTPVNPRLIDQEQFEAALEEVVTQRREALKKLAE